MNVVEKEADMLACDYFHPNVASLSVILNKIVI